MATNYPLDNPNKDKNYTPPSYGKDAFHCPHCKTYAHQTWTKLGRFANNRGPDLPPGFKHVYLNEKNKKGDVVASLCSHCASISLWCDEKMVYPDISTAPPPNDDLPEKALENYKEAAAVFSKSPRAAAALLRLTIEQLCIELGCKGENLYEKINDLATKDANLQEVIESLNIVRHVGNEGSHVGTIQLNETPNIVEDMFVLINFVAEQLLTAPKKRKKIINHAKNQLQKS